MLPIILFRSSRSVPPPTDQLAGGQVPSVAEIQLLVVEFKLRPRRLVVTRSRSFDLYFLTVCVPSRDPSESQGVLLPTLRPGRPTVYVPSVSLHGRFAVRRKVHHAVDRKVPAPELPPRQDHPGNGVADGKRRRRPRGRRIQYVHRR